MCGQVGRVPFEPGPCRGPASERSPFAPEKNFFLFFCEALDKLYILYILCMYGMGGGVVDILISNSSGKPIYEQISRQIKAMILSGELAPGEMLPSIRALAKDLRISVITTKRAYDELEAEGFLYTMAGKGCFVAERNEQLFREENLRRVEEQLRQAVQLAASCRIDKEELKQLFSIVLEEEV